MNTSPDDNGFESGSTDNQTIIGGNVTTGGGDFAGRDKYIEGDVVSRDKIEITNHYNVALPESSKAKWIPPEIAWPDGSTMVMLPIYTNNSNALFINKHLITNKQYRAFVQATNTQEPHGEYYDSESSGWREPFYPWQDQDFSDDSLPVVCVSYQDANHYCDWVRKLCLNSDKKFIQRSITLIPWMRIWEFAAFGTSFPTLKPEIWLGQTSRIHHKATLPTPIDISGIRTNTFGISDLFGNIWEWCSAIDAYEFRRPVRLTANSLPPREYEKISLSNLPSSLLISTKKKELSVELRGGSFLDDLALSRPFETASRLDDKENTRHFDLGFRICAKVPLAFLPGETVKYLSDNALETWD